MKMKAGQTLIEPHQQSKTPNRKQRMTFHQTIIYCADV